MARDSTAVRISKRLCDLSEAAARRKLTDATDIEEIDQSWHWRRSDPLAPVYARHPLRLLTYDQVGLDLGSRWIKYAVTRHGLRHPRLLAAGAVPVRNAGPGQLGRIRAQVGALLSIREQIACGSERWTVGISGPGTMVRRVEVPRMPRRELERAILWQAQKKMPFPLDEAHVAIQYLKSPSNQPIRAVVAAALRRTVDEQLFLLSEAEICPAVITLPAFGIGRLLAHEGMRSSGHYHGVLDIGSERSLFAVYRGVHLEFYREIDLGMGHEAQPETDTATDSGKEETDGGEKTDTGQVTSTEPGGDDTEDTARHYQAARARLILEIQSTLEYYAAQSGGGRITSVLFMGTGTEIPGLQEHLSHALETPVERLQFRTQVGDAAESGDEPATRDSWATAFGYSLLSQRTPNLLPPAMVQRAQEARRRFLWLTITGFIFALSLILSATEYYWSHAARGRFDHVAGRLTEINARLADLDHQATEQQLATYGSLLSSAARPDFSAGALLRALAALTPESITVDRLEVASGDSGFAIIQLAGEVRTDHEIDEVTLARYIQKLSATGWFQDLRLESFSTYRKADYEYILFLLNMRIPQEISTP